MNLKPINCPVCKSLMISGKSTYGNSKIDSYDCDECGSFIDFNSNLIDSNCYVFYYENYTIEAFSNSRTQINTPSSLDGPKIEYIPIKYQEDIDQQISSIKEKLELLLFYM